MFRDEFIVVAKGSNENISIYGGKDPVTTGAHRDANNRRMISHYGLEDCCGCMWQWVRTVGTMTNSSTWSDVYNASVDPQKYGGVLGASRVYSLSGATWDSTIHAGSRSYSNGYINSNTGYTITNTYTMVTTRGCSDPKIP